MFALVRFFPYLLALAFGFLYCCSAFTFTPGTPSQCDNLPISWTGGTPPFQLLLTPVFGLPQNISIPASAYNNGAGSFSVPIDMPQTAQLLLTMSDATGFNSGGTTPLLTVGASQGGASCNTTTPNAAFIFDLNSPLTQCESFEFTGYTGAVQPVTIMAFIPGGTAFELNPPVGSTSFSWTTNVLHGTSMIFSMTDSQGRQGGSSDIQVVAVSSDSSCLNSLSPSSTPAAPSATSTGSNPSSSPSAGSSHGISIAAIAGTAIGALLFLAVLITIGLFFLRKRRDSQTTGNVRGFSRPMGSEIDLTYDPRQAPVVTPYNVQQDYDPGLAPRPYFSNSHPSFDPNPFQDVPPQPVTHYQLPSQYQHSSEFPSPPENPVSDFRSSGPFSTETEIMPIQQTIAGQPTPTDSTSTSQRKAAMAGAKAYKPSRFVVHTDADDDVPQPNDDGIVELPPQYSERRGVLRVANSTADAGR